MRRSRTVALWIAMALAPVSTRGDVPPPSARAHFPAWHRVANGVSVSQGTALAENGGTLEWTVLRLDLRRVTVSARAARDETVASAGETRALVAAANAGFFDDDHRPSGALVVRGAEIAPTSPRGGSGVLVIRDHRASLRDATQPLERTPPVDLALQCGPRLIESDGRVGIYRDDGQRFARTAACLRDHGATLDLVITFLRTDPLRGPGLYAFSRMLAGPSPVGDGGGCESALNLDGGPSTGLFVRGAPSASHPALGPVPWLLTVSAPP